MAAPKPDCNQLRLLFKGFEGGMPWLAERYVYQFTTDGYFHLLMFCSLVKKWEIEMSIIYMALVLETSPSVFIIHPITMNLHVWHCEHSSVSR